MSYLCMHVVQQNIDIVLSLSTSVTHRPAATSLPGPLWRPQNPAWVLAKMGPGRPKSGPAGSRDLQNCLLDVLEDGLEGSGLVWTPILGSKGRFGRHLGATWAPREAFRERFWTILVVPNGSGKAIFWIQSGKVQNGKILVFPMCFQ